MEKLKKKVVEKIDNSLFLEEEKKQKIKELVKSATKEELLDLSKTLDSEMEDISKLLTAYLEKGGETALSDIQQIIRKSTKEVSGVKEEQSKKKDKTDMENLLKLLS